MLLQKKIFDKSFFAIGIVFISLLLIHCNSKKKNEENVLAQINDLTVTTFQFENAFKEYYYRTGQVLALDLNTKKAILDNEFNKYVLVVHAQDLGLDETAESNRQKELIERRVLTEEYLDQVILSDVEVSEEDLKEYYIRFNTTLTASHIYSRTKEGIEKFKERLVEGESFESVAKDAFLNPYLSNNGGDIGQFTTDELDIAFENKAFSMNVGEISEPVKTTQGYSIIKLTGRTITPSLSEYDFAQKKNYLYSYVLKKKKEILTREHLSNFVESVEFNDEILKRFWEKLSENWELALNKDSEFINRYKGSTEYLAESDNSKFFVGDFVEEFVISLDNNLYQINDITSFKTYILGLMYRRLLVSEAKKLGLQNQLLVMRSMEETFYDYLVDEVENDLYLSIKNTPAELYSEYLLNAESYIKPLEINLSRIVLRTKEEANKVLTSLQRDEISFNDAVVKYSINSEDRFVYGEQGLKSIKEYGFIAPKLSSLQENELTDVIKYQSGEYHIYKCLKRIEPNSMSFSEAKEEIDLHLTKKKYKSLRTETIEKIKEQHNAVIDGAKLEELNFKI